MGMTKQGEFERTYHHIDAPTVQDDDYGKEFKKRKLTIPRNKNNVYRDILLIQLQMTPWQFKRKLDGENLRVFWDGEQALWNGKSNKYQCGAELTDFMNNTFIEEIFEEKFGRDKKVYLFGEHMGPKSQGNELGLTKSEFVLYDVNINGFWLPSEDIKEIAKYFNIKTCYDFMPDEDVCNFTGSLYNLINATADGRFKDWEGIVATPCVECRYQNGDRVIVKIKNKDYLRG